MKTRNGFVSNSSSSSFIVQVKADKLYDQILSRKVEPLNPGQIELLIENGFIPTTISDPFTLEFRRRPWPGIKDQKENIDDDIYMALTITCNQSEVIYFLVKNNIPFKAACHYGHEFVSYEKDSDYMFRANNFGMEACMYGAKHVEADIGNLPKFEKIYVEEWLKREEGMQGDAVDNKLPGERDED